MENSVTHEIEQLIQAVPAPKVSIWQRIRAWWELRKLPRGQRMLKMGFKAVTLAQLNERMGVNALNSSPQLDQRWQIAKRLGIDMSTVDRIESYARFQTMVDSFYVIFKDGSKQRFNPMDRQEEKRAVIKFVRLSDYIHDEIPARCLADIKRAKRLGLGALYVAYPALETVPQKDPVVLAKWEGKVGEENSTMLEITWWE